MPPTELALEALQALGLYVEVASAATTSPTDLIVEPEGVRVAVQLRRRALVDIDDANRLLSAMRPHDPTLFVVADRVTDAARKALFSGQAGYLDLRGHVALRTDRLVLDSDIAPRNSAAPATDALAGRAGLEVATVLLMRPGRPVTGRQLARDIERSPSTVSVILSALREESLIDEANAVSGTDLFWRLVDRWPSRRILLAREPSASDVSLTRALKLGFEDVENEPGWALTDAAAAAAYGAPVAVRADQSLDFYVPDKQTARRAVTLLGEARSAQQAAASVRAAPVPMAARHRVDLPTNPSHWPLAHPLFVALDLGQDVGRGREILSMWTPKNGWTRVW